MAKWEVEYKEVDALSTLMDQYGQKATKVISEVLTGEGATEIKENIAKLIPASGRTFKGHNFSARSSMPGGFTQENGQLSVTISARGKYGYLYFPDDGSNTRRHAGNQQFMLHGAEEASERVIEMCLKKLTENFNR